MYIDIKPVECFHCGGNIADKPWEQVRICRQAVENGKAGVRLSRRCPRCGKTGIYPMTVRKITGGMYSARMGEG